MDTRKTPVDYHQVVESWYQDHNDSLQHVIGSIIRRRGSHGEGDDEMRAELNYQVFRTIASAARRGVIGQVVFSMAIEYAYRRWVSGERSYYDIQGKQRLPEEVTIQCHGDEWRFPTTGHTYDPARRAGFQMDMQTIGCRLKGRAKRVLREFIKDPHATDKRVCEALGRRCRSQYVFNSRQVIKRAFVDAGYYPPPQRPVEAPPEIRAFGRKAVGIYGACQRTPNATYIDIARRLGCHRSHVRWALHRFLETGVPWAKKFIARNAQNRCQQSRSAEPDSLLVC